MVSLLDLPAEALQIHTLHLLPPKNLKRVRPSFMLRSNHDETAEGNLPSAPKEDLLGSLDADTYQKHYEKQQELVECKDIGKRLLRVFPRLVACKRITFDSENPAWDPFCLEQSFGTFVPTWAKQTANARLILRLLFGVLTARSNIKVLEICSDHMIQKMLCRILTTIPDWPILVASLRRVRLVVEHDFQKDMLKKFLGFFPGLTNLNLEMNGGEPVQNSAGVLSDLHVPTLEKLTLVKVRCTATELENLIIHHQKTLQDITLICIKLPDDRSWRPILQKIAENRKLVGFSMAECLQDENLEPSDITELVNFAKKGKIGFET
ncbi:hypothetical protein FDENT_9343 [Fusarium denticulatum]|uniref:Uncharacterized protein n=1 Tax=Fusarium denticulatum TaxID=48507 RepID=A0A8H5TWJ1_9HYPO|nr:hypothetical protein FDENT_9343 [Fusarium denticulatum]